MRRVIGYLLPDGHTSNRRSLLICIVVGVLCILAAALAERLPIDLAPNGEPRNPGWALIQLLLQILALVVFCMCFFSAVTALVRRVGPVESVDARLELALVGRYLKSLLRLDRKEDGEA